MDMSVATPAVLRFEAGRAEPSKAAELAADAEQAAMETWFDEHVGQRLPEHVALAVWDLFDVGDDALLRAVRRDMAETGSRS